LTGTVCIQTIRQCFSPEVLDPFSWGVRLRNPDLAKPRWFIAKAGMVRHLYLVTLYPKVRHVLAINENGQIFDEVYQEVD